MTTLESLNRGQNVGLEITKDLSLAVNNDVIAYILMVGGQPRGFRMFGLEAGGDFGRRGFYFLKMGYFRIVGIEKRKAYRVFDSQWANTIHHANQVDLTDEEGNVTGTTTEDVLNKTQYKAIEIEGSFYVLITDTNLAEFLSGFTYVVDTVDGVDLETVDGNELVFELPIVESTQTEI